MPDEFEFYATPNPSKDDESQQCIDLPLTRAKSITRNRTLTFFILVFFSLGLSCWLLFSSDWKAYAEKKRQKKVEAAAKVEAMVKATQSVQKLEDAEMIEAEALADREVSELKDDEKIQATQLELFPGKHEITFRPDTGKEEGLSLFYVTGKRDIPGSDVFDFDESDVRLDKSQDELLMHNSSEEDSELDPVSMFLSVGQRQYELGDLEQALAAYARVVALQPQNQKALEMVSLLHSELGQFDEAEKSLDRLANLDPKNAEVRNNLAVVLLKLGREDDALAQLNMAIDVQPDYLDAQVNKALVLLNRGQFREVESLMLSVSKRAPRHVGVLSVLVKALDGQGKGVVLRRYLEQLIDLQPLAEHYFMMARSFLLDGDTVRAFQWVFKGKNKFEDGSFKPFLKDPMFEPLHSMPGANRVFELEPAPAA